jgi:hypothetical protein
VQQAWGEALSLQGFGGKARVKCHMEDVDINGRIILNLL